MQERKGMRLAYLVCIFKILFVFIRITNLSCECLVAQWHYSLRRGNIQPLCAALHIMSICRLSDVALIVLHFDCIMCNVHVLCCRLCLKTTSLMVSTLPFKLC